MLLVAVWKRSCVAYCDIQIVSTWESLEILDAVPGICSGEVVKMNVQGMCIVVEPRTYEILGPLQE